MPKSLVPRYLLAGFLLFFIAALRGENIDQDYESYLSYYDLLSDGVEVPVEPSFQFIVQAVYSTIGNPIWLFVIYAALGISVKMYAFWRLTPFKLETILIYYSWFFFLWEMNQIRAGVAGGVVLLSVVAVQSRRLPLFLILWIIACLFHYSALLVGFIYLLGDTSPRQRYYYYVFFSAITAMTLFKFSGDNLINYVDLIPIEFVQQKIVVYDTFNTFSANTFNYLFLARLFFACYLLVYKDILAKGNKYFLIMLKMYFAGLFIHVALSSGSGVGTRLSELLLVVEVVLIPQLIYLLGFQMFGRAAVLVAGVGFMLFALHYTELVFPYQIYGDLLS